MCVVIEMSLYFAHILGIVNTPENKKEQESFIASVGFCCCDFLQGFGLL